MQVNCINPRIILNPLFLELIAEHGNYTLFGVEHNLFKSKRALYGFKKEKLSPVKTGVKRNTIDSCFIRDRHSTQTYPMYLEVPCGHCEVCKNAKVNAFVERCKLETQCYNVQPLFLTLTYDENHKKECGVCLRDVQLFFKRLRINLKRHGYAHSIRYVLVAEYGKRFHRPHYHAILWNLSQNDILSYRDIVQIIEKSWINGFTMLRFIDPSNDKGFYYTSKYLRKDSHVPRGCNETFMVSSNRGGAIGAPFIDKHCKSIIRNSDTEFKYVNKWNSKVESLQYSRYVLNRLFPTMSRCLGAYTKSSIRQFLADYSILKSRHTLNNMLYAKKAKEITDFFGRYFYCPNVEYSDVKASMEDSENKILGRMLRAEIIIDNAIARGKQYYDKCLLMSKQRELFLEKLFLHVEDIDLHNKSYNIRRSNSRSINRELLLTPF